MIHVVLHPVAIQAVLGLRVIQIHEVTLARRSQNNVHIAGVGIGKVVAS